VTAASTYMLVFRILHIAAGVAWAGSVFLFVVLVQPTAGAIGPAASPFMMELLGRRRLVSWLLSLAGTTIVAGGFLYWKHVDEMGFGDFVSSNFGLALTIGSVAAIAAFLIGFFGTRPAVARLLSLAARAAAAEGPPPEVAQEIPGIQARLKNLGRTAFALIVVAVLAMATARYW
jgi:hypothetical protein